MAALLERHPDVTGLVVQHESAVGPVLAALPLLGRRVPQDVSVVAICPDQLAEQSGLTCVPVPAEEVGRQAVTLLMRRLRDEPVPEVTLLEPRLTVRDSSARAGR
ncbi:substrate-binding domain-containing protein [Micromonospora sp. MS34]|uniref:substrate-binding domain-containing protein n=1 Tax=Micromonospora sp. MS34 TaxID=3385971 RepID=UPI0039A181F2